MKYVDLLESEFLTYKDDIIKWMNESFTHFDLEYLKFESDGLVYTGDLDLKNTGDNLKVQFKAVTSYFDCDFSYITTLEGCPQTVGNYFSCYQTNITSLKFCPQSIGAEFYCNMTKITDPKEYRYALYSEIDGEFISGNEEINKIINTYGGAINRKHWPYAINLLSKVKL